jgi:type I restriction enzyme S subunit
MSVVGKHGYKETELGWIPDGWTCAALGSIARVNPSRTKPEFEESDVSFLAMGDVSEDGRVTRYQVRNYQEVAKGFTSFIDSDVLVAKITPCFENGKGALVTGLLGGVGFGSTEFHVVRAEVDHATPEFLHLHTSSDRFRRLGERNMVGSAGQKRVPAEFLREFQIAVPPLPEQQRIAAILIAVDDKLDIVARQIEATQTLKRGLMQTLFSRGVGTQVADGCWKPHTKFKKVGSSTYPAVWQLKKMGTIAPVIRREADVLLDHDYPELGLRSFGKGTFHKPVLSGADVGGKRLFVIKAGDLLLSNVFAWEGAIAVAKPHDDGRYGSHRYITCNVDGKHADANFIARYLLTPPGLAAIRLASPGGAGRNKTLGLAALADICIPLPPLVEQRAINDAITSVEMKTRIQQAKRERYQAVKRGLVQKLLTGEWRVTFSAEAGTA